MYIIGHNPCMSCIVHNPSKIKIIYIIKDKINEYLKNISNKDLIKKIKSLDKISFLRITKEANHTDHIIVDREAYKSSSLEELIPEKKNPSTLIILDQLTDQNNIGNIFRTAALTKVNGIIIPEHSSAGVTNITATISTGAVEVVKFHIAKNISRIMEILKKNNYWIYSLDINGEQTLDCNFKFDKRSVIILGNEGKGIRKNILENSDFTITLKQKKISQIDSFNAANTMAIALYHKSLNN
jgi:23S rRNA (guanosine2251-2'-O)-methyltransferase